ncbi:MAG: TolC family protein [Candidatus Melainabacteria bacterium]|nr:TolC family protein [Candidatus Melainabacteria bacterium]
MRMKLLALISLLLLVQASNLAAKEKGSKLLAKISLQDQLDEFKSSLFEDGSHPEVNDGATLDFDSFVQIVKVNHPDIVSAHISRDIAKSKRIEAQGAFDPSINSQDFFHRFNSSSDVGQSQEAFSSNTSLDFLTGYGAKFGLGARFAQGDIKTPISPTGDAGEYFVKAQIPLLRNAIYNSSSVKEKTAKLKEVIADYKLFLIQLKTLDSSIKAYWNWAANKRILDVETDLLNLVNGQVSFVEDQASLGNIARISIVEAEREVQKRQSKVNLALRLFQQSSLDLSQYIWSQEGTPYAIPSEKQVPKDLPVPEALNKDQVNEAKLNALELRPEFKALGLSRDISDLERKLARNQMLPQLDAYISSGIETGGDSIGPGYEAGFNISLPLRVRKAKGQKQQAEFKIKQLNLEERKLIQAVFLEIEDSASAVDTAYQRYLAAKQEYELSRQLEEGEEERFKLGDSTLFLVIRRQRATVAANVELIKTIADYHKARIRFRLVQGQLV